MNMSTTNPNAYKLVENFGENFLGKFLKFVLLIKMNYVCTMTGVDYLNKYRENLIKNATWWENRIKYYLTSIGIKFEFQKIIFTPKGCYIVDFYLPNYNIVIECDGMFHYKIKNLVADGKRDRNIKKYTKVKYVHRLKNKKISEMSLDKFKRWLKRIIK